MRHHDAVRGQRLLHLGLGAAGRFGVGCRAYEHQGYDQQPGQRQEYRNGAYFAVGKKFSHCSVYAVICFIVSTAGSVVFLPEGGRGGAMLVDGSAGGNDGGRKRFVRRSVYSFCLFSDLLQCPLHRTPAQQQFAGLGFVKPRRFGDHPRSAGHELVVGQLHVDHAVALDTPQADHHGCR